VLQLQRTAGDAEVGQLLSRAEVKDIERLASRCTAAVG
jgi:hypothetical protein